MNTDEDGVLEDLLAATHHADRCAKELATSLREEDEATEEWATSVSGFLETGRSRIYQLIRMKFGPASLPDAARRDPPEAAPIRYISVEEAADRLRLQPSTIRRYCRNGKLEAKKLGDTDRSPWRIRADSLTEL